MKPRYETVMFDLDGTLIESEAGVLNALEYALDCMGLSFPPGFSRRSVLGPPLRYAFPAILGVRPEDVETAVSHHRKYYAEKGAFEGELYPGLLDIIKDLHQSGAKVCVATSKFTPMMDKVIDHFGLRPYLFYALGSSGKETSSAKKAIIGNVLEHSGSSREQAVMIGDTKYDADGARENQVPFIGVLYGYGTQEEMEEFGAASFAKDAASLRQLLFL